MKKLAIKTSNFEEEKNEDGKVFSSEDTEFQCQSMWLRNSQRNPMLMKFSHSGGGNKSNDEDFFLAVNSLGGNLSQKSFLAGIGQSLRIAIIANDLLVSSLLLLS